MPNRATVFANLHKTEPCLQGDNWGEWTRILPPQPTCCAPKLPPPAASTHTPPGPAAKGGKDLLTRHLGPQCLRPAASSHLQFPGRAAPAGQLSCPRSPGLSTRCTLPGSLAEPWALHWTPPFPAPATPGAPPARPPPPLAPSPVCLPSPAAPGRTAGRPDRPGRALPAPSTAPRGSAPPPAGENYRPVWGTVPVAGRARLPPGQSGPEAGAQAGAAHPTAVAPPLAPRHLAFTLNLNPNLKRRLDPPGRAPFPRPRRPAASCSLASEAPGPARMPRAPGGAGSDLMLMTQHVSRALARVRPSEPARPGRPRAPRAGLPRPAEPRGAREGADADT